jgi:hypothetical protein
MNASTGDNFHNTIAPWLTISQDAKAIEFYKSAFAATEVYRYDSQTGGSVVRLSVQGAEFWVSEESEKAQILFLRVALEQHLEQPLLLVRRQRNVNM